jgi:hypothetical protein
MPLPVAEATVRQVATDDVEAPTDVGYNDPNLGHVQQRDMAQEEQAELVRREKQASKERKAGVSESAKPRGWQLSSHRPGILEHPETLAHDHRSKKHACAGLCQRVQMDRQR